MPSILLNFLFKHRIKYNKHFKDTDNATPKKCVSLNMYETMKNMIHVATFDNAQQVLLKFDVFYYTIDYPITTTAHLYVNLQINRSETIPV